MWTGRYIKVFIAKGFSVHSTDLADRGFGIPEKDFLKYRGEMYDNIITNPPYKHALGVCFTGKEICRM
jgi:hypothetical protein